MLPPADHTACRCAASKTSFSRPFHSFPLTRLFGETAGCGVPFFAGGSDGKPLPSEELWRSAAKPLRGVGKPCHDVISRCHDVGRPWRSVRPPACGAPPEGEGPGVRTPRATVPKLVVNGTVSRRETRSVENSNNTNSCIPYRMQP
jgi:hypothetical protein